MKSDFSRTWIESVQPRKQRKYRYNAPAHIKRKMLSCALSKELKQKMGIKSLGVRKGDKVKVLRGSHKGKEGKVSSADLKKLKVFVDKIEISKKDGNKIPYPLDPSNLMITEITSQDKRRIKKKVLEKASEKTVVKKN
ncbi:50S ribosomal protein L24 [Candidatus Woesearchaeota archaeon]|nr:50S ribosomal protein L24 [Candidatus Woesearchaeota archaeon]